MPLSQDERIGGMIVDVVPVGDFGGKRFQLCKVAGAVAIGLRLSPGEDVVEQSAVQDACGERELFLQRRCCMRQGAVMAAIPSASIAQHKFFGAVEARPSDKESQRQIDFRARLNMREGSRDFVILLEVAQFFELVL